jgi:hypothetical protein
MADLYPLENEIIHQKFQPHKLSFIGSYILSIYIIIWSLCIFWLIKSPYWDTVSSFLPFESISIIILWWGGLLAGGIIASLLLVKWRIFFIYLGILLIGTLAMHYQNWDVENNFFILAYAALISLCGLLIIDIYRRSHKYYITNFRLVLQGGLLKFRERTLRYDKITDIEGSQGILGFLFRFGDIIPVTQSGFGLGSDATFAGMGTGITPSKKSRFSFFTGGQKEIQAPRTRSYYKLHGAYPYKNIKSLLESIIQENTIAPYQKEQVQLQKEMVELLKKQY